jgi:hypothetical protein
MVPHIQILPCTDHVAIIAIMTHIHVTATYDLGFGRGRFPVNQPGSYLKLFGSPSTVEMLARTQAPNVSKDQTFSRVV